MRLGMQTIGDREWTWFEPHRKHYRLLRRQLVNGTLPLNTVWPLPERSRVEKFREPVSAVESRTKILLRRDLLGVLQSPTWQSITTDQEGPYSSSESTAIMENGVLRSVVVYFDVRKFEALHLALTATMEQHYEGMKRIQRSLADVVMAIRNRIIANTSPYDLTAMIRYTASSGHLESHPRDQEILRKVDQMIVWGSAFDTDDNVWLLSSTTSILPRVDDEYMPVNVTRWTGDGFASMRTQFCEKGDTPTLPRRAAKAALIPLVPPTPGVQYLQRGGFYEDLLPERLPVLNNTTLASRTFMLTNEYGVARNGRPMPVHKLYSLYMGGTMGAWSRRKRRNHLWGMLAPFSREFSFCALDEDDFYIGRPLRGDIEATDLAQDTDSDDMGVSRTRTPDSNLSATDDDLETNSGRAASFSGFSETSQIRQHL